jgi:hypothetical protein
MRFQPSPKLHPTHVIHVALLCLVTLALAPALAVAQDAAETGAVELRGGAISLDWSLAGDFAGATLRVSRPDGSIFSKQFAAGERVTLSLFDAKGAALSDGSYTWELTAAPLVRAGAQRKAEVAREAGATDGKALGKGLQRSGSFAIVNGAFVVPGASTRRDVAREDQVIPDDLIVQGSACVGFDCVNNESFGFDTIRLKENNLRIKFEDTSVGTFPTNDWQLTANDSASGASSKFSIEDITGVKVPFTITAGAATNSIFVDSSGRVGLKTSTPVLDLHVNTSNTPALRLEQNSSGGFTAQTWDIAGNEANFFVRDVTGGSKLPFRIRPGAPTSSIDISSDGDVGFGTASPSNRFHVKCNGAGATCGKMENASATGFSGFEFATAAGTTVANISHDNTAGTFRFNSVSSVPMVIMTESTERIRVQSDGDVGIACNNPASDLVIASGGGCANPSSSINAGGTQFVAASSRTFKENLAPVEVPDLLERIAGIGVYEYDFINGPKDRIGLMAEDFHQVFGRGDEKYIDGGDVQIALWMAVQQLTAANRELQQRLNKLEQQLQKP